MHPRATRKRTTPGSAPSPCKAGDTLSGIAQEHLGDASRYPEIFDASTDTRQADGEQLRDPDLIRPGWILTIPAVDERGHPAAAAEPAASPEHHVPPRPAPEHGAEPASPASSPRTHRRGRLNDDRGRGRDTDDTAAPRPAENPTATSRSAPTVNSRGVGRGTVGHGSAG